MSQSIKQDSIEKKSSELDSDWTEEQEAAFQERNRLWMRIMKTCYSETDFGMPLFDYNDIEKAMGKVFDAAREVVYIKGEPKPIYQDFQHYITVNFSENPTHE